MSKCTCTNSVLRDDIMYCPDCNTHTIVPFERSFFTQEELNGPGSPLDIKDKEKADKYDELVEKSGNGDDVIDIEGQKWLRIHPDMQQWIESHAEMVEWMTEAVKFPERSDCG